MSKNCHDVEARVLDFRVNVQYLIFCFYGCCIVLILEIYEKLLPYFLMMAHGSLPEYAFDAFVAYSKAQSTFVAEMTKKVKQMFQDMDSYDFKFCTFEEDFIPGEYIIKNICENMERSRKVIFIISKEFIDSKWFTFEANEAIVKANNEQKKLIIPVIYEDVDTSKIPSYMKSRIYLNYPGDNFYKKLRIALQEDASLSTIVPAGNVGVGLAWSYFYGYLNIILPGLKQRILESHSLEVSDSTRIMTKFIIIIPEDCYCSDSLHDADEEIIFHADIEYRATRAGIIDRSYKSCMYKIKDKERHLTYYFVGEMATPLLVLHEMEVSMMAGLTEHEKRHQQELFSDKVEEILESSSWRDRYFLLKYPWTFNKDKPKSDDMIALSELLLGEFKVKAEMIPVKK